ncbi:MULTISPECIES: ImmA/IrrE family metallo-endopeptidase [Erythrobacteraceae]|uniref:Putative Zn peptidase n=1 Tax=Pelagerythrobacter marensis TaxID=543877 RepID=A0A0G3XA57_9SPHN|nr:MULTISPECIES: ImmA/IrrE family metallo-endopeptidase [Erythrobacteraceae]AKM08445.1 Putative Zn peptidase [Pelagerythrobacter marensis]
MALRRGFKTEANATSREIRAELGLANDAPLCPFVTAKHLEVEVVKLSAFTAQHPEAVDYLIGSMGQTEFSAITVCIGTQRVVIYNDGHSPARCAANIMHELSHLLLLHPPHPLCGENGKRHFDASLEDEANWLGPALLVSDEAAVAVAKRNIALSSAANEYGVSRQLMQMRLNVTGAHRRASRAA